MKLIASRWTWELVPSKVGRDSVLVGSTVGRLTWQPCEQEPTCQYSLTEGTSVEIPTQPDIYQSSTSMRSGMGWALSLQKRQSKQWSAKISGAGNCKYGDLWFTGKEPNWELLTATFSNLMYITKQLVHNIYSWWSFSTWSMPAKQHR